MTKLLDFILNHSDQFRRRLPSLYSDFSQQRAVNPDGFAANVSAWQDVLQKATRAGLVPSNSDKSEILSIGIGEELLQSLESEKWGRPLALDAVIHEGVLHKKLVPLADFFNTSVRIGSRSWSIEPLRLFSWGLYQLGLMSGVPSSGKMPAGRYVLLSNVEEVANQILSKFPQSNNPVDQVCSLDMFKVDSGRAIDLETGLSERDFSILLSYLARVKRSLVYDDQIVKFRSNKEAMSPITPDDRTIASLKTLIANLNRQIVQDTARVAEYSNEAQTAVKNHNRSSALHALRSRKTAETSLSQRLDTLAQVQNVYEKIEQASDQIALISAMKASTGVLRNLNTQIGGIDTAEDILEGLQNEITKVDDISKTIQEAGQDVDDEAVDEELEDMMRQNRAAEEEKREYQSQEKVDVVGKTRAHPEVPNWSSTTDPQLNPNPSIKSIENKDSLVSQSTDAMKRMSLDDNPSGSGELSQVSKPPSRSPPVPALEI